MEIKNPQKTQKTQKTYDCDVCEYTTTNRTDYMRHLDTKKHIARIKLENKNDEKICNKCGKIFNSYSGWWKHTNKNTCQQILNLTDLELIASVGTATENIQNGDEAASAADGALIRELIKQNMLLITQHQEFKDLIKEQTQHILDLSKTGKSVNNGTINNMNANTNNSHNKFNLNVFLNETCKDAMNMSDFIDSLQITVKDLEETGRLGYASGISRIFINGLKKLGEKFRPIHCSDLKRETLYIKNNNEWFKDTDDNEYITLAIKEITKKNIQQIFEWQKMHPEYNDPDSKVNDRYQHMLLNTMSGSSKEETNNNYSKIIRNLAKEVTISKQNKLN